MRYLLVLLFTLLVSLQTFANDVILVAGQSNALALDSIAIKNKYQQLTGRTVDVYNCSVGDTYIIQHAQEYATTYWKTPSVTCRYIAQREKGQGHAITGIIFWQGESDTFKIANRLSQYQNTWSTDWLRNFQQVQRIFRDGLNEPGLPFVVIKQPSVLPGCFPAAIEPSYYNIVRELQVAAEVVSPSTRTLNIDDINYDCNSVHLYNQPGIYTTISERAAIKLVQNLI